MKILGFFFVLPRKCLPYRELCHKVRVDTCCFITIVMIRAKKSSPSSSGKGSAAFASSLCTPTKPRSNWNIRPADKDGLGSPFRHDKRALKRQRRSRNEGVLDAGS